MNVIYACPRILVLNCSPSKQTNSPNFYSPSQPVRYHRLFYFNHPLLHIPSIQFNHCISTGSSPIINRNFSGFATQPFNDTSFDFCLVLYFEKKKINPDNFWRDDDWLYIVAHIAVIAIVTALSFLSALALGPVSEYFLLY